MAAWKRGAWLLVALGAPLFVASHASAQQACGDTTCPKGFTCESAAAPCPAIACAPGSECKPCEPREYQYCAPAACDTDAQCGDGMVCAEYTEPCPGTTEPAPGAPACAPGEDCKTDAAFAPPPPVDCTPTTKKLCTPRWQLPCEQASDCGPGFSCVEQQACGTPGSSGSGSSGSGSSGTPSSGGATPPNSGGGSDSAEPSELPPSKAAPLPPEDVPERPVVTCEGTGTFVCQPIITECTTDSNCAPGWSCRDNPNGVCTSTPEGGTDCRTNGPAKVCVAPYSNVGGGVPGLAESPTNGGGTPPPRDPGAPGATPEPASGPGGSEDASSGSSASGGGCSMNPMPTPPSGLALVALGLAAAFRLRRRRSA